MIAAILRVLLFVALGPLAAAFAGNLAIAFLMNAGVIATEPGVGPGEVFAGFLTAENLVQAYRVGFIPSLATGIVALLLARAMTDWQNWLAVAFGGASISAALAWFLFVASPIGEGANPFLLAGVSGFAGGAGALICAAAYDGLAGLLRRRS